MALNKSSCAQFVSNIGLCERAFDALWLLCPQFFKFFPKLCLIKMECNCSDSDYDVCDYSFYFKLVIYSGHGLSGMGLLSILSFIMIGSTFASAIISAFILHWLKFI
jgi:hypothetical protein